jgi:aminodeoxyfutalosine synthase
MASTRGHFTGDGFEGIRDYDLIQLGIAADERLRARRGQRVTYVRVQELSSSMIPTDIEILPGAGELRIVVNPETQDEALALTRSVASVSGDVPLTGFYLDQLAEVCNNEARTLGRLLTDLRQAGLRMVSALSAETVLARKWLDVSSDAGVDVARLTIERPESDGGVDLLRQISRWGTSTRHVHTFAPLARRMDEAVTTGYGDMRTVALARLLVDNIDSIQVDWSRLGAKLAQVALTFGADDVDSVSPSDSLEHGPRRRPLEELKRNILAAGRVPVERDGCFEMSTL